MFKASYRQDMPNNTPDIDVIGNYIKNRDAIKNGGKPVLTDEQIIKSVNYAIDSLTVYAEGCSNNEAFFSNKFGMPESYQESIDILKGMIKNNVDILTASNFFYYLQVLINRAQYLSQSDKVGNFYYHIRRMEEIFMDDKFFATSKEIQYWVNMVDRFAENVEA